MLKIGMMDQLQVWWLLKENHALQVVGSNPRSGCFQVTFSNLFFFVAPKEKSNFFSTKIHLILHLKEEEEMKRK